MLHSRHGQHAVINQAQEQRSQEYRRELIALSGRLLGDLLSLWLRCQRAHRPVFSHQVLGSAGQVVELRRGDVVASMLNDARRK